MWKALIQRSLVVFAIAFWLGGFTFYGAIVIHVGAEVLGSHAAQGQVTQEVTRWLNLAGAIAQSILLWNTLTTRRSTPQLFHVLLVTWNVMAAIEVILFVLHPKMDRLLLASPENLDQAAFRNLHEWYVNLSSVQWGVGLIHTVGCVAAWRVSDTIVRDVRKH